MEDKKQLIEIWGDVVEIKFLVMAIVISGILTMGGYFLASDDKVHQLFLGLGGAVLGFIISTILIKPKRIIIIKEERVEK